jgi:hypothetical protein
MCAVALAKNLRTLDRRASQTQGAKLVAVALANKMARIAWKLMFTGKSYKSQSARVAMPSAA